MSDELLNELDAMTAALEEPVGQPEEPPADPPPPEDPPQDPPQDPPPPEEPPADPPPVEDPKDVEIRMLREQIEKLGKSAEPAPVPAPEPEPEPPADKPLADQDFIADLDLETLRDDPKVFNSLLNKIYKQGMLDSRTAYRAEIKSAMESVVKSMPDIVKNNVAVNAQVAAARNKFYKDNPDLENWKTSVATVYGELAAANPDKKMDEVMGLTAVEVRRRLGLKKEVKKEDDPPPPNLPGVKKGARGQQPPDLTQMQKEMDAMDAALGL